MKVLVIGGGQAGLGAAVSLRKKDDSLEIVLVDPKDYFEVRWASMRAFFDERIREEYAVLYESVCVPWNIKHVKDTVVALNKRSAKLASEEDIDFDACIVAVGAACPTLGVDPIAMQLSARKEELVAAGKQLVSGTGDVLVVGGGTLGCETAGEIAKPIAAAGHKVVVAQSGPAIVPEMSAKGQKMVANVLDRLGVEVLVGNRANKVPDTDNKYEVGDKVLEPSLVVKCTGYSAQNNFMTAGDLPKACVNERGWIDTDESFRVSVEDTEGRIFAFGDCCTTGANVASVVMDNYGAIVHNVLDKLYPSESEGKKKKGLKTCNNGKSSIIVLTLGPTYGVADLPFATFESLLPAFKNRTFFIGKAMGAVKKAKAGIDPKLVAAGLVVAAVAVWFAMRAASSPAKLDN